RQDGGGEHQAVRRAGGLNPRVLQEGRQEGLSAGRRRVPQLCAEEVRRQIRQGLAEGRYREDQRHQVTKRRRCISPKYVAGCGGCNRPRLTCSTDSYDDEKNEPERSCAFAAARGRGLLRAAAGSDVSVLHGADHLSLRFQLSIWLDR